VTTGTTTPAKPAAADASLAPLLIDIHALAVLLDRSVASLERDQAAGRLPAPVRIGGSKRWRRADIETWVAAGCPTRRTK
jgi:predicted DNA-binding transcriptional regulator AlpA